MYLYLFHEGLQVFLIRSLLPLSVTPYQLLLTGSGIMCVDAVAVCLMYGEEGIGFERSDK